MTVSYTQEAKYPEQGNGGGNWGAIFNGVLESLDAGIEVTVQAAENIGQYDAVRLAKVEYAIGGIDTSNDHFTVTSQDLTGTLIVGNRIFVKGSTGNDGTWTINTLTLNGADTEIYVDEDITNATVDGTIVTVWMYKAQANIDNMPAIGIVPIAVTSGNNGKVRRYGWIDDNDANTWDWDPGQIIYLSAATAGALVTTAPTRKQIIGIAKSPHRLLLQVEIPQQVLGEYALFASDPVSVNLAAVAATEVGLFTVPSDFTFVPVLVIAENFDEAVDESVVTLGKTGGTCDEFLGNQTLTNISAGFAAEALILQPIPNATPVVGLTLVAGETFGVEITTAETTGSAVCNMSVIGKLKAT